MSAFRPVNALDSSRIYLNYVEDPINFSQNKEVDRCDDSAPIESRVYFRPIQETSNLIEDAMEDCDESFIYPCEDMSPVTIFGIEAMNCNEDVDSKDGWNMCEAATLEESSDDDADSIDVVSLSDCDDFSVASSQCCMAEDDTIRWEALLDDPDAFWGMDS